MLCDFCFGVRFFTKRQNCICYCDMGRHLGRDMGRHLGLFPRPHLFHRNRSQRNHRAEHIALDKFRCAAGIELRIFVSIAHTGSQFISQADFPEHLRDRWVFGVRFKGRKVESPVSVGTVGILSVEPVPLYYELCHISAGIVPVCQTVGKNLPQDSVSGADAVNPFLHKGVIEMFLSKGD